MKCVYGFINVSGRGPASLFDMQKMFPLFTDKDLRSIIGTLYATVSINCNGYI